MKYETWICNERVDELFNQYDRLTENGMEDMPAAILAVGCMAVLELNEIKDLIAEKE